MLHDILYNYISPQLSMKPIHNVITLPSHLTTKISKMNLLGSLFSLLTDPDIMNKNNLLIDDITFRKPNENASDVYGDIHHSSMFKNAHKEFCKEPYDVLVPIIPFIDGTPIDPYGRNKLEVFMYTLGIFNQKTRNKPSSWRIAGYIPDPTNSHSSEHYNFELSQNKKTLSKRTDYHAMLGYLLHDFVHLEKSDGILINLPDKTQTKLITYRFKFVILYIIASVS